MDKEKLLRSIPSVDKILFFLKKEERLLEHGNIRTTSVIRSTLAEVREKIERGKITATPTMKQISDLVIDTIETENENSLKTVINLTGTVLHTNLGRAVLPDIAIQNLASLGAGTNNLEYELIDGKRGDRDIHMETLITELTGAESATVVNNNAAAVLLCLNTFAQGKEVCISRGELVEIGGSFRIPEVMEKSGSTLREVGTTNRTHLRDYEAAITENTGLLMKTHTSNYKIQGFTHEVEHHELSNLSAKTKIPLFSDLGSGTLVDMEKFDLPHETTVQELIESGTDLISFSGDKLLGGPQAGIIVGKKNLISRIKENPLRRALRVDKLTITALRAVLQLYLHPEQLTLNLPTLAHLSRKKEEIFSVGQEILPELKNKLSSIASIDLLAVKSQIGSGALPLDQLDSFAISIRPVDQLDSTLQELSKKFRMLPNPVAGRVTDGKLLFDLRTLDKASLFLEAISDLHIR
ncbi:MAG: L-seryl-tRNA(Sec) selenium transferase [Gammaproteobacteria bacterium]|nr:L-seryl-tRNA(Sec) selenium transferase [Gammaproteobacteria bacterium]